LNWIHTRVSLLHNIVVVSRKKSLYNFIIIESVRIFSLF
jgi:hypothetical protein